MTLRLFLLSPDTVFAARVNQASFSYPLAQCTFDGVTTGAYGDILPGMTILFGTSAGADDLGRQRVRKDATADTLYFGRSSQGIRDGEVDLEDNAYITILNDFRVWSKIPHIDIDDDGKAAIYKDADLVVSDRTTQPPPVANTGLGTAGTINSTTSLLTVAFVGTGSFAVADGASISTYLWDVDDGTITVGTAASSSITATFPAGFRWVSLTVTDDNGKTHTARCPVFARDPADDACIDGFEIMQHRITPQGQTLAVRIVEDIDADDYPDGTLAILFDGEPAASNDRSHMLFVGWHQTDPATIQGQRTGTLQDVTLNLVDVAGRLNTLYGFPQLVTSATSPATWTEMTTPNMDKYLHYLLHWHSTALELADWTNSGTGSTFEFVELGNEGQSLFDQVDRRCKSITPDHRFVCNRFGQLAVKPDPMLQDSGDRTATVQTTIDADEYINLRYTHQRPPIVHWLRGSAIVTHPSIVTPIFCIAPGTSPGQGLSQQIQGERLSPSQAVLNACEGHRYARLNAPQSYFNVTFAAGDDLAIEPADMTWVQLTMGADVAAQRGLAFTEARGLPHELNIRYDSQREGLVRTVEMVWERETSGTPAVTYIPPSTPEVGVTPVPDGGAFTNVGDADEQVALICHDGYIYRTSDFQTASGSGGPTWARVDTGITEHMYDWVVDPFSPGYRGTGTAINGYIVTEDALYKLTDIFGTLQVSTLLTFTYTPTTELVDPFEMIRTVGASFGRFFPEETDNPWLMVVSNYGGKPTDHYHEYATYSLDGGATWSNEVQIVTSKVSDSPFWESFEAICNWDVYLSPKTPGLAYVKALHETDGFSLYRSTNWGASWQQIVNPYITPRDVDSPLHVPWESNPDEKYIYHNHIEYTFVPSTFYELQLVRADGAVGDLVYVDTSDGTRKYGTRTAKFGVRAYDGNRQIVALAGVGNGSTNDWDDDVYRVAVSSDNGASWTFRTAGVTRSSPHPKQIAFGRTSSDVLYIWGKRGYIAYSDDFGATIDDRNGNIDASFSGASLPEFMGICGGPIA